MGSNIFRMGVHLWLINVITWNLLGPSTKSICSLYLTSQKLSLFHHQRLMCSPAVFIHKNVVCPRSDLLKKRGRRHMIYEIISQRWSHGKQSTSHLDSWLLTSVLSYQASFWVISLLFCIRGRVPRRTSREPRLCVKVIRAQPAVFLTNLPM
jgi:hypothetical protein